MAQPRNSNYTVFTAEQGSGAVETINSQTITGYLADTNGDLLLCTGTTVPTNGGTGYAKGCLFIDTDVGTGTTGLNCNKGTNTSCAFTAVTQA
jgi:hypothetical protein